MTHEVLRHICVRDVNLAVTVLCQYTRNSHGTENFIAMVGSGSDTHDDFHPLFFTQNQAKILNLKGLNRRRSTP